MAFRSMFTRILDYNFITIKRGKQKSEESKSKSENDSTIVVANYSSSNIKSLITDMDYRDKLYDDLVKKLGHSLKNMLIYIIWDRDSGSNEYEYVEQALKVFGNALDNDYEMNGLLLLSYPCLESFELSNFDKNLWRKCFSTSFEAKKAMKVIRPNISDIDDKPLLWAVENMHRSLGTCDIGNYEPADFKSKNLRVFREESNWFENTNSFKVLSLISVMLIDLGIIF